MKRGPQLKKKKTAKKEKKKEYQKGAEASFHSHMNRRSISHVQGLNVEGHLWKAQWKEKPNDEGHSKLTMNS